MVYYQQTPLIIKKEQTSHADLCLQTLETSTLPAAPHHREHNPQYVSVTNGENYGESFDFAQHQNQNQNELVGSHESSVISAKVSNQRNTIASALVSNIKTEEPSLNIHFNKSRDLRLGAYVSVNSSKNLALDYGTETPTSTGAATVAAATAATSMLTSGSSKPAVLKPGFKCDECGMTFGSKSAHTSHTKSHAKNGKNGSMDNVTSTEMNVASAVPGGIPKVPQLKQIASITSDGDPYKCNVCQKTFAVPARLIRHYRTHTGERPFECEFCHKLFSVKENLQVHRRIHTKERPYKCEVCGRAFEHSGKLHRHMRIHTGERPHKCTVCQKTFIQSGQLVIHMRTHTGEKPYKCPVEGCGKGFTCSKQLKVHSRTHTGEKPYHCDICFRDFGYNHVLKLHRVQHYGSKCYKCTICDETFKNKKEMEAHIKGHANEIPDDEDSFTGNASGVALNATSSSTSSSTETTSPPNSPQLSSSPILATDATTAAAATKATKVKQPRQTKSSQAGSLITTTLNSILSEDSMGSNMNDITNNGHPTIINSNINNTNNNNNININNINHSNNFNNNNNINHDHEHNIIATTPDSSNSTFSSSPTSFVSTSRLSTCSPSTTLSSITSRASPTSIQIETDYHSCDSGVASSINNPILQNSFNNNKQSQEFVLQHHHQQLQHHQQHRLNLENNTNDQKNHSADDLPTDLSFHPNQQQHHQQQQQQQQQQSSFEHEHSNTSDFYLTQLNRSNFPITIISYSSDFSARRDNGHTGDTNAATPTAPNTTSSQNIHISHRTSHAHQGEAGLVHAHQQNQDLIPTINPALLEAATIARREEDATQALQILKLNHVIAKEALLPNVSIIETPQHFLDKHGQHQHQQQQHQHQHQHQQTHTLQHTPQYSEMSTYDDAHEANELIEHYKRGELVRHVQKGYAPVPKFKSSLINNEIIVRQVEAAIAPLRSSTDSPERSSSPESDSMLMANRDIMTLPLRKRKLYMSEDANNSAILESTSKICSSKPQASNNPNDHLLNSKVIRKSSVIQFAKAS